MLDQACLYYWSAAMPQCCILQFAPTLQHSCLGFLDAASLPHSVWGAPGAQERAAPSLLTRVKERERGLSYVVMPGGYTG